MTIKIEYSPNQINTKQKFGDKPAYEFLAYCWLENVQQNEKIEYVVQFFKLLGFKKSKNNRLEPGFEKIAILVDSSDKPIGVFKQLVNGSWTRKIWGDYFTPHYLVDKIDLDEVVHQYIKFMKRKLG